MTMNDEIPWAFDGSPTDYELGHVSRHKPTPKKRSGMTPEAKVSKAIDTYLKTLPCLPLRTSAGLIEIDGRKIQMGRAGVSDRTVLFQGGLWASIEIKATTGLSEAQKRYKGRVEDLGGLFIEARSADDVRQALIVVFGETTVDMWEATARLMKKAARKRS
jgi:hypothetical protein